MELCLDCLMFFPLKQLTFQFLHRSLPDEETSNNAHLFFYVADEGGKSLTLGSRVLDIHGDSILASGSHSDIGDWQLHLFSEVILLTDFQLQLKS